jgi:hypothetical protein
MAGTTSGLQHFDRMPRYYFHSRCLGASLQDQEGCRMLNDEKAVEFARETARKVLGGGFLAIDAVRYLRLEVVDESGKLIAKVPLRSVMH